MIEPSHYENTIQTHYVMCVYVSGETARLKNSIRIFKSCSRRLDIVFSCLHYYNRPTKQWIYNPAPLTQCLRGLSPLGCSAPMAWGRDRRTPAIHCPRGTPESGRGKDASIESWRPHHGNWIDTCDERYTTQLVWKGDARMQSIASIPHWCTLPRTLHVTCMTNLQLATFQQGIPGAYTEYQEQFAYIPFLLYVFATTVLDQL